MARGAHPGAGGREDRLMSEMPLDQLRHLVTTLDAAQAEAPALGQRLRGAGYDQHRAATVMVYEVQHEIASVHDEARRAADRASGLTSGSEITTALGLVPPPHT